MQEEMLHGQSELLKPDAAFAQFRRRTATDCARSGAARREGQVKRCAAGALACLFAAIRFIHVARPEAENAGRDWLGLQLYPNAPRSTGAIAGQAFGEPMLVHGQAPHWVLALMVEMQDS